MRELADRLGAARLGVFRGSRPGGPSLSPVDFGYRSAWRRSGSSVRSGAATSPSPSSPRSFARTLVSSSSSRLATRRRPRRRPPASARKKRRSWPRDRKRSWTTGPRGHRTPTESSWPIPRSAPGSRQRSGRRDHGSGGAAPRHPPRVRAVLGIPGGRRARPGAHLARGPGSARLRRGRTRDGRDHPRRQDHRLPGRGHAVDYGHINEILATLAPPETEAATHDRPV